MKKSEILEEAKKYLVPENKDGYTCYICNAVLFVPQAGRKAADEIVSFVQDVLDATPGVLPGYSIYLQTKNMNAEDCYELRLMFMDFLILMYKDEERST